MVRPPTHLLYLHGFRSSPQSAKAQALAGWLRQHRPEIHWWCPALPPSPAQALALIDAGVSNWPARSSVVVGSSLGGFYASVLAERLGWPAVVINPAVDPARDLAHHIGEQSAFHHPEERFFFDARFVEELRAMTPSGLRQAASTLALIAKGDEVLDWREMAERYAQAHIHLIEGSDHALSDFEAHLPDILAFLKLTPRP